MCSGDFVSISRMKNIKKSGLLCVERRDMDGVVVVLDEITGGERAEEGLGASSLFTTQDPGWWTGQTPAAAPSPRR